MARHTRRPSGIRPTHRRPARGARTCPFGKVRFPDHRAAVAALHAASRSRGVAAELGTVTTRQEVRCYRCTVCAGYHLTSQAPA